MAGSVGPGSFVSGAVALVGAPVLQASHSDSGWLGEGEGQKGRVSPSQFAQVLSLIGR